MLNIPSDLRNKKRVGIIGGNSPDIVATQNAFNLGKLIAKSGYILINGGMGGVMESSAQGAKSKNGFVIGILPGKNKSEGNPFSDITIPTGLGYIRNPLVVINSDVLVAINGSYGTLSEIAYTQIYNKTVFGLNTWDIPGVIPLKTPEEVITHINNYFEKKL